MKNNIPGLLLCAATAAAAFFLSMIIPAGSVTIAIILGMLICNMPFFPAAAKKGVVFCEKRFLPAAIALAGLSLDYGVLRSLGASTLVLILFVMTVTILTAAAAGRLLGLNRDLSLLTGIGNAVCGSSAIAAARTVIKTDEKNAGISIAVINLLGTAGMFILPAAGRLLLNYNDIECGTLLGAGLQAVGQVTAAGYSINETTGSTALIVKMCRVLMLTPLLLILNFTHGRRTEEGGRKYSIPLYIVLFIVFSVISSTAVIPEAALNLLKDAGKLLLITAMAAVGMRISFGALTSGGKQALTAGIISWACQLAAITAGLYLIRY